MEVVTKKEITIIIELTEFEARWLKGVMQNPITSGDPDNEYIQDSEMRRKFWDVLKDIKIF